MKILNVGQRDFVTRYGLWKPMEVIEVPDNDAEDLLAYGVEVKIVENIKTVERVAETAQSTDKTVQTVDKRQRKVK